MGGRYRIGLKPADGPLLYVSGTYLEIKPPEKLVFTWQWEGIGDDNGPESTVTVEFVDRGKETDLVLTHRQLTSQEAIDNHRMGWESSFAKLSSWSNAS